MVKYSLVIPAHNEEANIWPLVDDLRQILIGDYEILIVDDNSKDGTPLICDKLSTENPRIKVLHRSEGLNGMGHALMDGSKKATGKYVFWVMGDRSDRLDSIPEMIALLDSGYDVVIASRYMSGGSRGELEADKALYGSAYTQLARLIFGLPVHDITNAYRGFRKGVLDDVRLESGDFAISPEFAIKAHLKGYRLGEVPTTYFNRRAGQTNFKIIQMGIRYASLFLLRFKKV